MRKAAGLLNIQKRSTVMAKVSIGPSNSFCPQTLFVYGTYSCDSKPDFGLFCWVSYYWDNENNSLGVMAAICEDKRTRDNIRRNGVFFNGSGH
jgi:hypothetical protein